MNESQTIFTLFFAISWGIVSNVLPRWKPFHCALFLHRQFSQPTIRLLTAFTILNILPWLVFCLDLYWLRDSACKQNDWEISIYFWLIPRAILPGLVPFGFYRLWVAVAHSFPNYFYAASNSELPQDVRTNTGNKHSIEPTMDELGLRNNGIAWRDLFFAIIYIGFATLAIIKVT